MKLVEFKTDNKGLFEFSLEEVTEEEGWELLAHTFDLHHQEDMMEGNVMTEYEEKFSSMGNPICKLIARCERIVIALKCICITGRCEMSGGQEMICTAGCTLS